MPAYDPVSYPPSTTPKLSQLDDETLSDPRATMASRWPESNIFPDDYDGPPPSREFETASLSPLRRARPVPAVPPPADAPAPMMSIAPPPGHTAQP